MDEENRFVCCCALKTKTKKSYEHFMTSATRYVALVKHLLLLNRFYCKTLWFDALTGCVETLNKYCSL